MSAFEDLQRHAPFMPGNTCPDIDALIAIVRSASRDCSRAARYCEHDVTTDELRSIERTLDSCDRPIEALRKQNEQLRAVAEYWREQAETLCTENANLAAQVREWEEGA